MAVESIKTTLPLAVYFFLFIQLFLVAIGDIKFKKIPNLWSIFNLALFLIFLFIYPDIYKFSFAHTFFSIAFFFVGFFLFMMNIMGGGDSKYLSSLFLLLPENHQREFFTVLLYLTVLVGAVLLTYNTIKNFNILWHKILIRDFKGFKEIYGSKFTYAPLILVSWIIFGYIIFYDPKLLSYL